MAEKARYSSSHFRWPPLIMRVGLPLLLVVVLAAGLSACSFQPGGDLLAFIRDGTLYVSEADGSGLRSVAQGNIVGLAWSPDHHQMVFRSVQQLAPSNGQPGLGAQPDATGDLFVTSVSGGTPLQITQSGTLLGRSDAWWNIDGNRLLYRESIIPGGAPTYIVSQADQPVGIARKGVQSITGIPVLSADGSHVFGLDDAGNVHDETVGHGDVIVAKNALTMLPGVNRPAQVLLQPRTGALLYEVAAPQGVSLVLQGSDGKPQTLMTTAQLLDVAFSPDGTHLLMLTQQGFELWPTTPPPPATSANEKNPESTPLWRTVETDPLALPWWSPDGRSILVQDQDGMHLIDTATGKQQALLVSKEVIDQGTISGRWRPAAGSPWSPDGKAFAFAANAGALWQGQALPGKTNTIGIYVATLGAGGLPKLIASGGRVSAPTWSYLDPSTVFLVTA